MHILSKRSLQVLTVGSALIGSLALAGTAFAAAPSVAGHNGQFARPAVAGTVASAPDGSGTFTVTVKGWQRGKNSTTATTPTTYTVTTTSATTVTKIGVASTVSAIAIGDTVLVQGTTSGTSVAATKINDGVNGKMGRSGLGNMPKTKEGAEIASHTPAIAGNGQPVIGGNVTAITGTTLTVTNKSNVTYTVDMTSAKVTRVGVATATTANIVVGDSVVIQGAVNGSSVMASSIIDNGAPSVAPSTSGTPSGSSQSASHKGILGTIGGFFSHLFGF